MDTIFALASGQGRAGIAVVRISGSLACRAAKSMCGSLPKPRQMAVRRISEPDGSLLDEAMVVWFPEGQSFTGEETVELHLHGSTAIVNDVLECLSHISNVRIAEPGEFTRRALENGRLDLTQVEGLADLIEAETRAQRVQAMETLSGALGERAAKWRGDLIKAASLLEVTIDFADEDVPVDVSDDVAEILEGLKSDIERELSGFGAAERIRSGFEVAIVGAPNAGKSTLLNALAGREAALTSDVAGTTRDVIEVRMDIDGLPVTFLDTAGIREGGDSVEVMGIDRAIERAAAADVRVFLIQGEDNLPVHRSPTDLVFTAKGDLFPEIEDGISGATGLGVDRLVQDLGNVLKERSAHAGVVTHQRQRTALLLGQISIDRAQEFLEYGSDQYEFAADEIRTAVRALERMVGKIDVEDLLDSIFSSFCLGK